MIKVRKNVSRALIVSLVLVMVFVVAGALTVSNAATKPTKMTVKTTTNVVDIKGQAKITVAKVSPSKASKAVSFKSSNSKVATVSKNGTVTGKKKGTVKITVTSKKNKKLKKTVKITVKDMKIKGVSLNNETLKISKTWSETLKANVDGSYKPGVVWKSSNTNVVTVNSSGVVTGKSAGTATVTATVKGGTKKASCKITVIGAVKSGDEGLNYGKYTWDVIDVENGKALLYADHVLEFRAYNNESKYITWADSDIREYLNGAFIDKTFSTAEKSRIKDTALENNDNAWYGSEGGEDTVDKVFLLSVEEMLKYFGNETSKAIYDAGDPDENVYMITSDGKDEDRIAETDASMNCPDDERGVTWYFLRTPGAFNGRAVDVSDWGAIIMYGDCCVAEWGIRPAMWVSIN